MAKLFPTVDICGVRFHNVSMKDAVDFVVTHMNCGECGYIVTPNVDHVVRYQDDSRLRTIYGRAILVVPDGMPIVWGARILGTPLKQRVAGSDLFLEICKRFSKTGNSIFLLGGAPGSAERAAERLTSRWPSLRIVGTYCPAFGFERDTEHLQLIRQKIVDAKPDLLFVGLGSPKQEYWISDWLESIETKLAIGVGVSFSFVAGDVRRAPKCFQQIGMEWLWRLAMEPRRLWKRYLVDDIKFFKLLSVQLARGWLGFGSK